MFYIGHMATNTKDRRAYFKEYNKNRPKKDRRAYYREYNKKHPERLNRGFTKGCVNGNASEGKVKERQRTWYDRMFNPTLSELLYDKNFVEWHDDDWCEDD